MNRSLRPTAAGTKQHIFVLATNRGRAGHSATDSHKIIGVVYADKKRLGGWDENGRSTSQINLNEHCVYY